MVWTSLVSETPPPQKKQDVVMSINLWFYSILCIHCLVWLREEKGGLARRHGLTS
jgi:hypothetical protein